MFYIYKPNICAYTYTPASKCKYIYIVCTFKRNTYSDRFLIWPTILQQQQSLIFSNERVKTSQKKEMEMKKTFNNNATGWIMSKYNGIWKLKRLHTCSGECLCMYVRWNIFKKVESGKLMLLIGINISFK